MKIHKHSPVGRLEYAVFRASAIPCIPAVLVVSSIPIFAKLSIIAKKEERKK